VDLPFDEARELRRFTDPKGIAFISLIAPTTEPDRIRKIAASGTGFLYFISITGITGTAKPVMENIKKGVAQIRKTSSLPTVIGFGISTPAQAAEIATLGEGIVVGSALMKLIDEATPEDEWLARISSFVMDLKRALTPPKDQIRP